MRITTFLLIGGLIFLSACVSTPVDPEAGQTQEVLDFQNTPKNELYNRSLNWLALKFGSAREVIEVQDRTQGKIIGNIYVRFTVSGFVEVTPGARTKLIFDFQDNRVRITLSPVGVKGPDFERPLYSTDMKSLNEKYGKIIEDYKAFVSKKAESW
jgi:hypothetical protein